MKEKLFFMALFAAIFVSCKQNQQESVIPEKKVAWEKHQYIDEFGDPTNSSYAIIEGEGTFKNSVTNNGKLDALLYVDKENVTIRLYEYGDVKITSSKPRDTRVLIYVKGKDNKEVQLGGPTNTADFYDGDFQLTNKARKILMPILYSGGKIKFNISYEERTYNFTIPNADGLKSILDQTKIDHTEDLDSI